MGCANVSVALYRKSKYRLNKDESFEGLRILGNTVSSVLQIL